MSRPPKSTQVHLLSPPATLTTLLPMQRLVDALEATAEDIAQAMSTRPMTQIPIHFLALKTGLPDFDLDHEPSIARATISHLPPPGLARESLLSVVADTLYHVVSTAGYLLMVAEGWGVIHHGPPPPIRPQPADEPNRFEALIIAGCTIDGRQACLRIRLDRNPDTAALHYSDDRQLFRDDHGQTDTHSPLIDSLRRHYVQAVGTTAVRHPIGLNSLSLN